MVVIWCLWLGLVAFLEINIIRQQLALDRCQEKITIYESQMNPLQKVMNGIYCSDIEKDEYLKSVWDYKNKFGGK